MTRRLVVRRSAPGEHELRDEAAPALDDGQARLRLDMFGLSSNNISYALFGEALGYWAHFPGDDENGCVPVWGFADVTESLSEDLPVGIRLFGYLPMADELVITPGHVTALALSDVTPHRAALHPWYGRYYRCDADPVWSADREPIQATMWALFMTGWALANELADTAETVVVSSASSKTALSLAWTLQDHAADVTVVGLTSQSNAAFVEASGTYDRVITYDSMDFSGVSGPAAFVDAAGSPAIREQVHAGLGDRLADSVGLGATHQGAGAASGELAGPTPRFFFIPDVAEQLASDGLDTYHQTFADSWQRFAPWIAERLTVSPSAGDDAIAAAYQRTLEGSVAPHTATILTW